MKEVCCLLAILRQKVGTRLKNACLDYAIQHTIVFPIMVALRGIFEMSVQYSDKPELLFQIVLDQQNYKCLWAEMEHIEVYIVSKF